MGGISNEGRKITVRGINCTVIEEVVPLRWEAGERVKPKNLGADHGFRCNGTRHLSDGRQVPRWTCQDPWPKDGPPMTKLAQCKLQCQINDNSKDNRAEGANGWTVGVNLNHGQGAGGGSNDGNNDGRLCYQLCFCFKGKFHAWNRLQRGDCKMD